MTFSNELLWTAGIAAVGGFLLRLYDNWQDRKKKGKDVKTNTQQ